MQFLFQILPFILFFLLVIIDAGSHVTPSLGTVGLFLWIASYILPVGYFPFFKIIHLMRNRKFLITGITTVVLVSAIVLRIPDARYVSAETTQQIRCGLESISSRAGSGFNSNCFIGYPARQFYIPALPSYFFGPSIRALNAGGSIYVLFGLIFFVGSAMLFLKATVISDLFLATLVVSIFHITHFTKQMFQYEQSIYPFGLSLTLVGCYLLYMNTKKLSYLGLCGVVLYFLIHSYTPGLAMFFLGLFFFLANIFRKTSPVSHKALSAMIVIAGVIAFAMSVAIRQDLRLYQGQFSVSGLMVTTMEAVRYIFFTLFQNSFVSPIMIIPLILSLVLFCIWGGGKGIIVVLWVIGTILTGIITKGYVDYSIGFKLHRALIIFPVIFAFGISLFAKRQFVLKKYLPIFIGMYVIFFTTGLWYHHVNLSPNDRYRHTDFIQQFVQTTGHSSKNMAIYFDYRLQSEFVSLNDSLLYFMPHSSSKILATDCANLKEDTSSQLYLVTQERDGNNLCPPGLYRSVKVVYTFFHEGDMPLYVIKISSQL